MNIFAALPDERADQAQPYPEAPFPQMLRPWQPAKQYSKIEPILPLISCFILL
ncbi:hypothetical protein B4168_1521 [Anoxybacillus flavithermus]|nr:hypothetical protein B4168_1521 [Anoxybacillus flavithermus]OAO84177.1 hypothetical protein GT23_3712 [Parageobacillus thermoglucosidasius]